MVIILKCLLWLAFTIAMRDHRAKSLLVLRTGDKGTDHPSIIVRVFIQGVEPKIETIRVWITPQVTVILREDKGWIKLLSLKGRKLNHIK